MARLLADSMRAGKAPLKRMGGTVAKGQTEFEALHGFDNASTGMSLSIRPKKGSKKTQYGESV